MTHLFCHFRDKLVELHVSFTCQHLCIDTGEQLTLVNS